jgi:hypothetical protein
MFSSLLAWVDAKECWMISVTTSPRALAWVLCLAGVALSAFVSFVEGEGTSDWLFPLVFVIGPWIVLAAPESPMDVFAYMVKPFLQVLLLLPVGLLAGSVGDRLAAYDAQRVARSDDSARLED